MENVIKNLKKRIVAMEGRIKATMESSDEYSKRIREHTGILSSDFLEPLFDRLRVMESERERAIAYRNGLIDAVAIIEAECNGKDGA